MKHNWRQWLQNVLAGGPQRKNNARLVLESLEDRTLPSGVVPFVESISRMTPAGPTTNATSVSYSVTFNEPVTGVAAGDFQVKTDNNVQAATPVGVSGSGAAYTVGINGIHGSGDLRLDLINNDSIQSGGVPLANSFHGQTYNIL